MLELLYDELLMNKHGKEIEYLTGVYVYPQEDENVSALHVLDKETVGLTLRFPALPSSFGIDFEMNTSVIALYGGDKKITIESMAHSLSHEYGHITRLLYVRGRRLCCRIE
jgi:hypothetical protein